LLDDKNNLVEKNNYLNVLDKSDEKVIVKYVELTEKVDEKIVEKVVDKVIKKVNENVNENVNVQVIERKVETNDKEQQLEEENVKEKVEVKKDKDKNDIKVDSNNSDKLLSSQLIHSEFFLSFAKDLESNHIYVSYDDIIKDKFWITNELDIL